MSVFLTYNPDLPAGDKVLVVSVISRSLRQDMLDGVESRDQLSGLDTMICNFFEFLEDDINSSGPFLRQTEELLDPIYELSYRLQNWAGDHIGQIIEEKEILEKIAAIITIVEERGYTGQMQELLLVKSSIFEKIEWLENNQLENENYNIVAEGIHGPELD